MAINVKNDADYWAPTEDTILGNGQNGSTSPLATSTVVLPKPPETVTNGQTTVVTSGTRVQLSTATNQVAGVTVKSLPSNTGEIYVGDSAVAAGNGYILVPGEPVFISIKNLTAVYVDAAVSGEGVCFIST